MIEFIDNELLRVKDQFNESGYHVGTALYPIVRRYRDELKMLRETIGMNLE